MDKSESVKEKATHIFCLSRFARVLKEASGVRDKERQGKRTRADGGWLAGWLAFDLLLINNETIYHRRFDQVTYVSEKCSMPQLLWANASLCVLCVCVCPW